MNEETQGTLDTSVFDDVDAVETESTTAESAVSPDTAEVSEESKPDLNELVSLLHDSRIKLADQKTRTDALETAFHNAYAVDFDALKYLKDSVAILDSKIRAMGVDEFAKSKSKTPAPGITIKEITKYEYDPKTALKWAQDHQMCLIPESLDSKAFEALCNSKSTRPDFVTESKVPRAEIAKDLSKALKSNPGESL